MRSIREYAHIEARYWNGNSSAYGTTDQLIGMLRLGWRVATIGTITRNVRGRFFTVYMFELRNNSRMAVMHVVANPVVRKFVRTQAQQDFWVETQTHYQEDSASIAITVLSRRQAVAI